MGKVDAIDYFAKSYYKVTDFETGEVIYEKEFLTKIANELGIKNTTISRNTKTKRGYYPYKKKGEPDRKLKFVKLN